jgi:hypothetical protein
MVSATDPTAVLLESQGTYYFHLISFIMITFFVTPTSEELHCVKMTKNPDYSNIAKSSNWDFKGDNEKQAAKKYGTSSFVNQALKEL